MEKGFVDVLPYIKKVCLLSDLPSDLPDEATAPPAELLAKKDDTVSLMIEMPEGHGLAYVRVGEFRAMFPKVVVEKSGPHIATSDLKVQIPVPADSSLGRRLYSESDLKRIHDHNA